MDTPIDATLQPRRAVWEGSSLRVVDVDNFGDVFAADRTSVAPVDE